MQETNEHTKILSDLHDLYKAQSLAECKKRGRPMTIQNADVPLSKKELIKIYTKKFREMYVKCDCCNMDIKYYSLANHLKSSAHLARLARSNEQI